MMLSELSQLLEAVPGKAPQDDYRAAVLGGNCLAKRTAATRALSMQRLRELYALHPDVLLFSVLRDLWPANRSSRPLLALLMALARDPLLRATAATVIGTPPGHELPREPVTETLGPVVEGRLKRPTVDKVVRNALSSWTQSGHLRGRTRKTRQRAHATPASVTFALLLAYATGKRGRSLFETPWVAVLDREFADLLELASDAGRLGLLDLKQSGAMLDVSFPRLITDPGLELMHGPH